MNSANRTCQSVISFLDLAVPTCIDAYGITYSRPNQSTSGLINYLNVVHIYQRMKIRSEEFVDM